MYLQLHLHVLSFDKLIHMARHMHNFVLFSELKQSELSIPV